jgi:MFS family permease
MVGLVMSSFGIARLFVEIPGGLLTDRFGEKPLILLGGVLSAISHLLAAIAQTYVVLIASLMVSGIGSAVLLNASLIYVGRIATPEKRTKYISLFQSTFFLSNIIGPTLGGLMSDFFNLRTVFFVSAVISAIGLLFVLVIKGQKGVSGREALRISNISEIIRDIRIIATSASCFVLFFLFNSIQGTMIPLYGVEKMALNSVQIGLIFSLISLIIAIILLFIIHRLEVTVKKPLLLSIGLLICSFSVFLISFSLDFITLSIFTVPFAIGLGILQPIPFALLIEYAKAENRGLAMGIMRTVGDLGIVLGPIIVGWLLDLGQALYAFYLIAIFVGVFSLLTRLIFRKFK